MGEVCWCKAHHDRCILFTGSITLQVTSKLVNWLSGVRIGGWVSWSEEGLAGGENLVTPWVTQQQQVTEQRLGLSFPAGRQVCWQSRMAELLPFNDEHCLCTLESALILIEYGRKYHSCSTREAKLELQQKKIDAIDKKPVMPSLAHTIAFVSLGNSTCFFSQFFISEYWHVLFLCLCLCLLIQEDPVRRH